MMEKQKLARNRVDVVVDRKYEVGQQKASMVPDG